MHHQADQLLHNWLKDVSPFMHPARRKSLEASVRGAMVGGRLTVTSLGRSMKGGAKEKHNIKRADRLLSNTKLQSECGGIYKSLCKKVIGKTKKPIILIDWTDVDERRKFFILRAATPVEGRALTLYEEVHEQSTKETRITQHTFLERLKDILPPDCTPIIVTDAGFRTPWFRKVQELGWDFVGRVRNREKVSIEKSDWMPVKTILSKTSYTPKYLGQALLTESKKLPCQLVLYKGKPKGRILKTKMGFKSRAKRSVHSAKSAREPWLLATSLSVTKHTAKRITNIYKTRMQIEESFRDLKCTRFGLSLYLNGTYKLCRLIVLILIGALTNYFSWILGKLAKKKGLHKSFQANTHFKTSVLSAVFLGVQIFRNQNNISSLSCFKSKTLNEIFNKALIHFEHETIL